MKPILKTASILCVSTLAAAVTLGGDRGPARQQDPAVTEAPHLSPIEHALGAMLREVPPLLEHHMPVLKSGALVTEIATDSLLREEGVCRGDVIIAADGRLLESCSEFLRQFEQQPPQKLLIARGTRIKQVDLAIGAGPTNPRTVQEVVAINVNISEGSVSITGTNGLYHIVATYSGENGQLIRIDEHGPHAKIQGLVNALPEPLRRAVRERM
ncbi:hypothetical protein [Stratiformator vulcanicus]|uniref:PDZ domain-containing protein n=1 Tax=Stratiformator vulcanicus TaxID=2527980 RepID=A0A517QWN6_9PLAN|nr:hypothetical protein [Stratiformator vulcanicus]QDT36014.1 hypothetical protein Pan189_03690 [Stratiformator vulcanicus]